MGNNASTNRLKSDFKSDNTIDSSLKKVDHILTNLLTIILDNTFIDLTTQKEKYYN